MIVIFTRKFMTPKFSKLNDTFLSYLVIQISFTLKESMILAVMNTIYAIAFIATVAS